MTKNVLLALFFSAVFFFSCSSSSSDPATPAQPEENQPNPDMSKYSNQVILDWNLVALQAMGGPTYEHSLFGARLNAMVHLAMHDALNAIAPVYQTYALQRRDAEAEPIVAAATAAYTVLLATLPDQQPLLNSALAASLQPIPDGDAKVRGAALGKEAGEKIAALRQPDGALQDPIAPITPATQPGMYQAVPPYDFVFAPFWATMQPFALERPEQFRCAPQPAVNSSVYARDYTEVKTVGSLTSQTRTDEQTFYAKFWYEGSEIGWNTTARVVAADKQMDLPATARLFALVDMALADAYTAGWDSKFYYNFWRPYTAIRGAENDGNPDTEADARWEALMETPPVQDYPSTHSTLGNAAATVLATIVGDSTSFTITSSTAVPADATRSFTSFSQAADENADSRVMAGIHFRFSCEAGQELGNKIGEWTARHHLLPLGTAQKQ
jgi:hypothetical protein